MVADKDLGYKALKKALFQLDQKEVAVGLWGWEAQKGAWQEFGTKKNGSQHIPERPFMRMTAETTKKDLKKRVVATANSVINTKSVKAPLEDLGKWYAEETRQVIIAFSDPPNAESTIARKGFNDPLIGADKDEDDDSLHMRDAVTHKVRGRK